ncbi:hypothetical protein ACE1B6_13495 [Aerosakkonemataceae cyanobacterium BLCC-F154]|uniref:Uncharacterized protein n=1 Tax=Floridaenema fluviatile BLCC-F154 TaxID=3153640 RepID=A0ABV4YBT5_9CYAN
MPTVRYAIASHKNQYQYLRLSAFICLKKTMLVRSASDVSATVRRSIVFTTGILSPVSAMN